VRGEREMRGEEVDLKMAEGYLKSAEGNLIME